MSEVLELWKSQLLTLLPDERAELACFLLESLDPDEEEIDRSWAIEVSRRVEEIRSGKAIGIPVDDLLAELRERYP